MFQKYGYSDKEIERKNRVEIVVNGISVLLWLLLLRKSQADNAIYLLCALISLVPSVLQAVKKNNFLYTQTRIGLVVLSVIFSVLITVSNFDLFRKSSNSFNVIKGLLLFVLTIVVFLNMLKAIYVIYVSFTCKAFNYSDKEKINSFVISFLFFLLIDWLYLFLVAYPGNLTNDSMAQIGNILSGKYSNHHPVYHTLMIKACINLATFLGADINIGILLYSIFQSIVMSLIFAYTIRTMCELGISKWGLGIVFSLYALLPYHWAYSVTMGKDVVFGGVVLCFIVTLYRCRRSIGNEEWNNILLFVSALGFMLLRSNGLYAFVVVIISLIFCSYDNKKRILWITVSAFIIAVIMRGPVLEYNDVTQPDTVESLSIPLQQVARYICEDGSLNEEEYALLNSVMDVSQVKEKYMDWISDPIKNLVRDRNGNAIISDNKFAFLKLWIDLGLKQPESYVSAWVDLTKAYMNSAYSNGMIFYNGVVDNDYGIERKIKSGTLNSFVVKIEEVIRGEIITAIGLCVWLYIIGFAFSIMQDKRTYLECLPLLAIILSLLIATPVCNEFRYVYALFTSIPAVGVMVLQKK